MISQYTGIPSHHIQKLFWGTFAFRVDLTIGKKNRRYIKETDINRLTCLMPSEQSNYRIQNNGYGVAVYFKQAADLEELITKCDANKFRIHAIYHPRTVEHLSMLQQDLKIVFRKSLFYSRFEWRMIFKALDYEQTRELTNWVNNYFDKDQTRYQFTQGVNCVLYLVSEDDIMIAKLTQAHFVRKVEKVVVDNNNNKEDTNETRTLSQAGRT